jgi:nicotinate-nucleotide adenylyltransferase
LCLLMGMDAFSGIEAWYHWQELLDFAHIIVTQRPDTDFHAVELWSDSLAAFYAQHKAAAESIQHSLYGTIQLETVTQLSISATDIRERIKNSQSIRFLTPESVINLIQCYNLYK